MTDSTVRRVLLAPAALLLVAACSSGGASSAPATGGTAATPAPPAGSAAPSGAPSAATGAGIGGDTDFCWNTIEEVSAVLGVEVTTAQGAEAAGVGGGCNYSTADGSLVYAISTVTSSAAQTFEAAKGTEGAVVVTGVGDGAVLMSAGGPLIVRVGDVVLSLGPLPMSGVTDPEEYRKAAEELGKAAVARM
jgi:hypothetical protein